MKERSLLQSLRDWIDSKLNNSDIEKSTITQDIEEKKISVDVVYEPDVKDAHNNWMSAETLEKACEDFNKNLKEGKVSENLFHQENTAKFEIVKSWIDKGFDCTVDASGEPVKEGSWLVETKFIDDKLWEAKKKGIVKGVSIFGYGIINEETGEITELTFEEGDNAED